tara:strand:+ start:162227 stop:162337 length:111 start_codon:yes stop_codon:yes gene_type:complete
MSVTLFIILIYSISQFEKEPDKKALYPLMNNEVLMA